MTQIYFSSYFNKHKCSSDTQILNVFQSEAYTDDYTYIKCIGHYSSFKSSSEETKDSICTHHVPNHLYITRIEKNAYQILHYEISA